MDVTLHDLCGADPTRRFSPYCWRVRMALAHKGIAHETIPWRFTQKATIADAGTDKVPVLRHGGRTVHESWRILEYLEDNWPGAPTLFGGEGGRALARFVNTWADAVMIPGLVRLIISDIPQHLAPEDAEYFIRTREERFGKSLAELTADRERAAKAFRQGLHPLRMVLRERPWLSGPTAGAADYIAFGPLQWARCVSAFPVLAADDPVHAWRGRLLDAFGGLARSVPAEDLT
ncbi:glutathione S-transferase family protein [Roseomonas xinghualingensis]|uniref:glutathione S-transferase family protein n=1 Tax=Roseomonas xinghualingensis TaxID=2986475 RepID=UPI0021F10E68|nr:glutathione S-transferase family protein [Roseomonas sp. SXEYE001]MCV4209016.1 glutathione S-transferase family protein [Roseomonas sp. SXEYE001]